MRSLLRKKAKERKEKVKKKKISVSFRGDFMRVAPNVYNDPKDFERLLDALR